MYVWIVDSLWIGQLRSSSLHTNSESSLSCLVVRGTGSASKASDPPLDLDSEGRLCSSSRVGSSRHLAEGDYCLDPFGEAEGFVSVLKERLSLDLDSRTEECWRGSDLELRSGLGRVMDC